ncbi:MAG TPA: hypothetical protein VET83_05780 [Candidatus Dormibacteraeota bacterium]|nr:hypothetical protein [Candidatus Dormibacteraeota bacterium]
MKRLAAGLSLAAALLWSTGVGLAQDSGTQRDPDSQQGYGSQRDHGSPGNYDTQRNRGDWGRERGRFQRVNLEGRWVAEGRDADFRPDRGDFRGGGMRGMLLPGVIRIDQRPSMVRVTDARHRTLQEILINRRFDPRDQGRFDSRSLTGSWRGSSLVVQSTGPRGGAITQTFALQDRGRTLVVRTKREGWNAARTVEFTRVYHRA